MVALQVEWGHPLRPKSSAQDHKTALSDLRGSSRQPATPVCPRQRPAELAFCWSFERGQQGGPGEWALFRNCHQIHSSCVALRTCWTSSVLSELQPQAQSPFPGVGAGKGGRGGLSVGCHAPPSWPFLSTLFMSPGVTLTTTPWL